MKLKTQNSKLKTKFRFLDDIATADLAYEAFGSNTSELFENAALALEEAMVSTKVVRNKVIKRIEKKERNLGELLFQFLEELVFLKDAENLVFSKVKCEVEKDDGEWELEAHLMGDKIDPDEHKLGADVKAITKHKFAVEKLPKNKYKATVILDV